MKISILGGSGFLGTHIINELSKKYKNITVLDLKEKNFLNKKIRFIKINIANKKLLKKYLKGTTLLYHLAGLANLDKAFLEPTKTYEENVKNTIKVLEVCKELKIKKIIYSSSLYANGNYGGFYGCSKKACENYIEEFGRRFNLNYLILRYGSLYGPGSDNSNGLYKIVNNAIKNKQVSYKGDPRASREYIHVYDAAKSTIELSHNNKFNNLKINISGNQNISIKDLLETIKDMLQIKKKILFKKQKLKGHYVKVPYTSEEITKKYITNPHVDFNEGLNNLINYIQRRK